MGHAEPSILAPLPVSAPVAWHRAGTATRLRWLDFAHCMPDHCLTSWTGLPPIVRNRLERVLGEAIEIAETVT